VGLLLVLVTAPFLWPLLATVPLFLVFFVLWTLSTSAAFGEEVGQRYLRRLTHREELKRLKAEWKILAFDLGAQFDDAKMPLVSAYEQLKGLKDAYRAAYAELRGHGVERQRVRYLQGILLSDVQIDGIGPTTTAELAFYGFETAYDIDLQRLQQTRNFTRNAMETLVAWRRRMETEFRYDATQGVPEADRQALAHKFIRTWQELKQTLTAGADELRDVAKDADRALKDFERRYRQEEATVAQAEADFRAVS
jgi:DNA-binding helix-hairpin-helix protein with protein kinase domain